jgi:hypothetical protein
MAPRLYIPEDKTLLNHLCENLYLAIYMFISLFFNFRDQLVFEGEPWRLLPTSET